MKKSQFIVLILVVLFGALQYRLWFGKHSIPDYWQLKAEVQQRVEQNAKLIQRNSLLEADINDLKIGIDAVEERARNELGLIKEGETFFRIVPKEQD
ncbi:cell division protein FtsB [Opacimonas viscosa]|uniref:Cell division protein FtsB n=1 Tax=Opacimonas viscosa TaxID=2961944 RepID=A0AA41X1J8_9ALTE|nr:cell division protein FtsB [Opacimonas viscosa]